jgi:hypothetical protein
MKQGSGRRYPILNTHNALVEGFGANQKEGQYELRGFAPIGMLEYWNDGIMGLKQHSAKGRGQRVKNFYTMRYALCALLIFIPCAGQKHRASKNLLISASCTNSEMLNYKAPSRTVQSPEIVPQTFII